MSIRLILLLSIVLQLAAAALAWRLNWAYGRRWAWTLISAALALMALPRCITFYRLLSGTAPAPPLETELVALAISVLLLPGIALIDPMFRTIRRAEDVLKGEKQQLAVAGDERLTELQKEIRERQRVETALREGETRFRELYDEAPVGYHESDALGRITRVNRTELEMLGYTAEEMVRRPVWEFIAESETARQAVQDKLSGRVPPGRAYERAFRRKNGSTLPVLIEDRLLCDDTGRIIGIRSTIQDITEHLRAAEALKASEERFRSVIHAAHDAFIAMNPDGLITEWNPQAEATFGWSRDEAVGRPLAETIIPPRYREAHRRGLEKFLSTGEGPALNRRLELSALHRDGREFPVELTISPIPLGPAWIFSAFVHDITERKAAQEAIAQHAKELARSNAELEQFAYVASHDLQEPLRMIGSYLQLLERRYKGRLDADADDFIAYAVDGAARMQGLINDLLAYARVGMRAKPFECTDTAAALDQAVAHLEVAIATSQAAITRDPLPNVMGDRTQLVQLLQNLIGNAIKFRGPEPPRVHVSAERRNGEWLFSVRDNGIGIDPQYADRIFEVFQRLHGRGEYPGTGIGLALCKKIVERHGGRIWVESQRGQGSVFYFTLPTAGA